MSVKTAQQALENYLAGMSSGKASENYKKGISGYTGNPMAEAAKPENIQKYLDGVQRSVSSGRRVAALNAANPATWKDNSLTVGASRLSSGAQKAKSKLLMQYQRLAPIWQQQQDAARAITGSGLEAAKAKQNAALEVMMRAAGTA